MAITRRWRPLVLVFLVVPLLFAIALAVAIATRPPPITSHRDAIRLLLDERGVAYTTVSAVLPWPESMNYYAYGSSVYPFNLIVRVRLASGEDALGRVECRNDQRNCWLSLVGAGVDGVQLRDIDQTAPPDWLRWVRRHVPWLPI